MEAYLQHLVAQSVGLALIIVAVVVRSRWRWWPDPAGYRHDGDARDVDRQRSGGAVRSLAGGGAGMFLRRLGLCISLAAVSREPLHRWRFKRYQLLLDKTGYALIAKEE